MVSSASAGGSRQRAARAASFSTAAASAPASYTGESACRAILFMVNVPVLSLHSTFMPANSSTAARRATMAPCVASSPAPMARVVVLTI